MLLDQFDQVGVIKAELLEVLTNAPKHQPKDVWVEKRLDDMFGSYDWSRSFSRRQILVYDEVLPSEVLEILHKWLRRKCADIENILLVVTHHTGASDWWRDWCKTNNEKSFQLTETFFLTRPTATPSFKSFLSEKNTTKKDIDWYASQKNISKLLSYYGGTYSSLEREYLFLKLQCFDHLLAHVDFLGNLSPKQDILSYVENITYYKDQMEIDYISSAYDRLVNSGWLLRTPNVLEFANEDIDFAGLQWQTDRQCFVSVVRETINSDKFACVTEKTLRAFLHHCVVIPTGFNAVNGLEKLGFWFPHDFIDYSYQSTRLFADRVHGMMAVLDTLAQKSFDVLQQYYLDNIKKFQYNSELVYDLASKKSTLQKGHA